MGRGLRLELQARGMINLPDEFLEWRKRKGKQGMSLTELVEDFKEWERERSFRNE